MDDRERAGAERNDPMTMHDALQRWGMRNLRQRSMNALDGAMVGYRLGLRLEIAEVRAALNGAIEYSRGVRDGAAVATLSPVGCMAMGVALREAAGEQVGKCSLATITSALDRDADYAWDTVAALMVAREALDRIERPRRSRIVVH